MAAKLSFNDIYNQEIAGSKLTSVTSGFNNALSVSAGVPNYSASIGALYIDSTAGNLYRNTTGASSGWVVLISITAATQLNKVPNLVIPSTVSATDGYKPAAGDLVGIISTPVWGSVANLNVSRQQHVGGGTIVSAIAVGGSDGTTISLTNASLWNGTAWAGAGTNPTITRNSAAGAGGAASFMVVGGHASITTGGSSSATELYNGAAWTTGTNLPSVGAARGSIAGLGTQMAAMAANGSLATTGVSLSFVDIYNGTVWQTSTPFLVSVTGSSGCGSQNAALVWSGAAASITNCELFNGSSWLIGPKNSLTRTNRPILNGSQFSAIVSGGLSALTNTEYLNGSIWTLAGFNVLGRNNGSGAGGQNSGLAVGGSVQLNSTEACVQTVYRKAAYSDVRGSKMLGISDGSGNVLIQGSLSISYYPANKFLIVNRFMNSSVTNIADLTAVAFGSVLGVAPTMTYNFSTTANLLGIIPGTPVYITSSGANPISAANQGAFIVSRVISPSSIEITNASGIAQNPGTGTLSFISSMIAVDTLNPGDILIGKTDYLGRINFMKQPIVSSPMIRLK